MRPLLDIRSFLDTRGGVVATVISLVLAVGLAALVGLVQPSAIGDAPVSFEITMTAMALPLTVMLPILAVFLIASDWSAGTIQTTFLQRPRRELVLASKSIAALVISAVVVAVGVLAAIGATALGGTVSPHGADFSHLGTTMLQQTVPLAASLVFGGAMAVLLQSTPLALILAIAVPFILQIAGQLVSALAPDWLGHLVSLFDVGTASTALADGSATGWNAGALVIMLLVPVVFGAVRWSRREVG